jgi:glycosyltransferase involved in cell wall biosynthesis
MAAYRLTNALVDHMTIVSEAAFDRFVTEGIVPKEILRVVPNGVDTSRFRNVSPRADESVRRSLGLGSGVRFLGVRSDVPEVMSAADGYVMSSAWEGMPMTLLEAAAAAFPIVATKIGGNHEVVRNEGSGFLVPPGDHEALGLAMLRLSRLSEPERRAMGERGREHIRTHYGLGRVAERWEDLYREVLVRKGLALAPQLPPADSAPSFVGGAGGHLYT